MVMTHTRYTHTKSQGKRSLGSKHSISKRTGKWTEVHGLPPVLTRSAIDEQYASKMKTSERKPS